MSENPKNTIEVASAARNPTATNPSHARVAALCLAGVAFMGALSFASVPLYRMFCQVTGYGGTTQRAEKLSDHVIDRIVTVRFDANVSPSLAWKFEPVQRTMQVRLGENALAFYRATNTSDKPLIGTAAFNVAPDSAGLFFNKVECFCFKEQRLEPGQSIDMPVTFFVDPEMVNDESAKGIANITLSYVFYPVAQTAAAEGGTEKPSPN